MSVHYNQQNNCSFDKIFEILTTSTAEWKGIPEEVPRPMAYYANIEPGTHPFNLLALYDKRRRSEHDNNYKVSQLSNYVKFLLPAKDEETHSEIYNAIDEVKSLVFKQKKQLARCTTYDQWMDLAQHIEKLHQLVIFYCEFKHIPDSK